MREKAPQYNQLPDGSWDFGNGVISASLSDRNHFNSLPETRKGKTNRLTLPVTTAILGSIGLACSGGGNKNTVENTRELEKESSGYALPFPEGETWFLTNGPHGDNNSAIDIAPPEGGFCPQDGRRFTIDNRVVTASASGEVTLVGDDKNRSDPFHSIVDIKDRNGLTQRYIHLDNIKVKSGKKIKQGDRLGNPSCEFPPKGGDSGPHVHIGLMKDGQAIPIDGVVVGGWTIHEGTNGKEGTMTKPGEKTRTADIGRYGENSTGIRNDLPNNPNRAVVASPKNPIPPISGNVKEKSVQEKWQTFKSPNYPYEIQFPATWVWQGDKIFLPSPLNQVDLNMDMISDKELTENGYKGFYVVSEAIPQAVTLDDYVNKELEQLRNNSILNKKGAFPHNKIRISPWNGIVGDAIVLISQETDYNSISAFKTHYFRESIFLTKDGNGLRAWIFGFLVDDPESIPESDLDDLFRHTFGSLKITSATTAKENPKSVVEKKISISKRPDELFKVLLTSPISPDILPQGMSSRGNSAAEIDETGKALKQVGAITIKIEDPASISANSGLKGIANGGISYSIFPDSSTAKSASELIGTHLGDGKILKDFSYPAKVYTLNSFFGVVSKIVLMSVENVTVVATFTGTDPGLLESRAISLSQAAIKHLEKVGK